MKMDWKVLSVAAGMLIAATIGAGFAAAQGPAGAGATTAASSSNSSSGSSHSYNPIKWVKKGPNTTTEPLDAKSDQDKRLTSKLQVQGLLPANTSLTDTCSAIKGLDECVAALHAGHNLGLDFNCLRSSMTAVHSSTDIASCKATGDKAMSLSKAIHALKPDADSKAAAKNAEKQAHDDLKRAGS